MHSSWLNSTDSGVLFIYMIFIFSFQLHSNQFTKAGPLEEVKKLNRMIVLKLWAAVMWAVMLPPMLCRPQGWQNFSPLPASDPHLPPCPNSGNDFCQTHPVLPQSPLWTKLRPVEETACLSKRVMLTWACRLPGQLPMPTPLHKNTDDIRSVLQRRPQPKTKLAQPH